MRKHTVETPEVGTTTLVPVTVVLPSHLRRLARLSGARVTIETPSPRVDAPVTVGMVLDALEERYPMLRGLIRDHGPDGRLKAFMRVFGPREDLTPQGLSAVLPAEILSGQEELRIVAAIAGG